MSTVHSAGSNGSGASKGVAVTNWLVSKTSGFLERRTSRRGFLVGSAVTGSAVAAVGVDYALKPGTAYAQLTCPPGSFCGDGWTEFCCAVNNGVNACPTDSFAGGWWRADFSTFCNGTRYYIDCMQHCCGPGLGNGFCAGCRECTCPGGCGTRRAYCNYFRYGQCHTEIPTSGPIACRVVSCVPPYTVAEFACSPAAAVDNRTAEHAPNCAVNVEPAPPPPPQAVKKRSKSVISIMLYNTMNTFFVNGNGALVQKVWDPGPGADGLGWKTYNLTGNGVCRAGATVDVLDGFMGNFHVTTQSNDLNQVVHLTFVRSESRWVQQSH